VNLGLCDQEGNLRPCLYEKESLRRVLVRKGVLTNEEVLEEVKAVRGELRGDGEDE